MVELRTVIPDEIDRYLDTLVGTGPFNNKAELVRAALASYTSMAGPMAQVFDKENIFSPDGRIYQAEYARESALRALPSVGVVYPRGVVLVARTSSVLPRVWYPRLLQVGEQLAIGMTGLVADGYVTAHRIKKTNPQTLEDLVDELAEWYWENNSRRDRRPLGVFSMVASTLNGDPHLLLFQPIGACTESGAVAVGKDYARIQSILDRSPIARSGPQAEKIAFEALGKLDKGQRNEVLHLRC